MGVTALSPRRGTPLRAALRRSVATPLNALVTVVVVGFGLVLSASLARWAIFGAVWSGTAADCRVPGAGACWTFVGHKLRFILFGLYPPAEQWRTAGATIVLVTLIAVTARPRFWHRRLLFTWLFVFGVAGWLLHGGLGLQPIPTRLWGGLPITLMLSTIGLAMGFPIGVVLALARRSHRPVPRFAATAIVETVRGVPLIAVLYLAALVLPLAMPAGLEVDKLLLAQAGIVVFAAAYLGEAVRAGLQMVPPGQMQAALALGLRSRQAMRLVILPQALKIVIPSFVSIAVGLFQDTSLVVIIGLFDLLNTARIAPQDPVWLGFHTEAFVFAALIYFAGSASMSRYGLSLERYTNPGRRPS